jgi:apolipoprotein N-acyltransferase
VLDRVPRDFEPGDRPGLFSIAGHEVATIICFESAFGYQVRPLVRDGAQVLVVSTNNRSYERSANSAQHVAIGQLRAAETGRPVVQAAISGISAIIDANGVVHRRTALFDRTVLEATVTATTGETPYVRYGEWVVWASGILLAAAVVLSMRRDGLWSRTRESRPGFVDSPAHSEPRTEPRTEPRAESPSDRPAESSGDTP